MTKISIIITTYNQEEYISQAIESVLMQQYCPEYEIVIGNDCSTDNTGLIIEDYRKKYPDKIKVLYRNKNLGMLHNLKDCFENCSGEYIAILEGDDYWIDNEKLRKQYDLLSKKNDALLCFNDIYLKYNNEENLKEHLKGIKKKIKNKISFEELVKYGNPIANFSCCMYRKKALKYIPESYWENKENADWLFNLYLLDVADGIYLKDRCSVYRINDKGIWSSLSSEEKCYLIIKAINEYNKLFNYKYTKIFMKQLVCIIKV